MPASYWKWSVIVHSGGRQYTHSGDIQGPGHATEDKILIGIHEALKQIYPRGYEIVGKPLISRLA